MTKQDGMSAGLRFLFDRNGSHIVVRIPSPSASLAMLTFPFPVSAHPRVHGSPPHPNPHNCFIRAYVRPHLTFTTSSFDH
jgi:hypothetical protein